MAVVKSIKSFISYATQPTLDPQRFCDIVNLVQFKLKRHRKSFISTITESPQCCVFMDSVLQNIPTKMNETFLRIAFVLFTYFIFCPYYLTDSFSGFKLTSYRNKVLADDRHCFQNITEVKISNCFQHCLSNCLCTSFQMCESTCQLCSGGGLGIIRDQEGCSHFNFTADEEKTARGQQCQSGCARGINCCMTSQPCFNGGNCVPQYSTVNTSRFTCQDCAEGYTGNLCQTPIKSCRGYKNGSQIEKIFKIFDKGMNLVPVLCDFDKDRAWTLIQSYKFENHDYFKSSFFTNKPNRTNAPNTQSYRMSKPRMQAVAQDSSKWRITCNYQPGEKISYTDYVETSLKKVDILTFNGNRCVEVDYIGIRGKNCTNCTAYMLQSHNREVNAYYMGLHFDSKPGPSFSCDHNASDGSRRCGKSGEDDFGFYDCYNTNHRCSATSESLTSAWLGG